MLTFINFYNNCFFLKCDTIFYYHYESEFENVKAGTMSQSNSAFIVIETQLKVN